MGVCERAVLVVVQQQGEFALVVGVAQAGNEAGRQFGRCNHEAQVAAVVVHALIQRLQQGSVFGTHGAQADDLAVGERELFGWQCWRRFQREGGGAKTFGAGG